MNQEPRSMLPQQQRHGASSMQVITDSFLFASLNF
jgi:hypothetical protein